MSFDLDSHIKSITKSSFHHLKNSTRIRPFLTLPGADRLIHAFVTSRIDYSNALFVGLPANLSNGYSISRIQQQVFSLHRVSTLQASSLHFLPVHSRTDFKTLTLTYKAVHGMAPSYICDLDKLYVHSRSLQSANSLTLQQPACRFKSMGERSFSIVCSYCQKCSQIWQF